MAQINVSNLTFCYEGGFDYIFEEVSFCLDTDWKLGFIGRNGKGKTTFLRILQGKLAYQGTISATTVFDYFPYEVSDEQKKLCAVELLEAWKPGCELWRVCVELEKLQISAETLYRPFETLSHGERTKIMLGVLFAGDNDFLLIDEPTNHLDYEARNVVKEYLKKKKGFLLVSHDRDLLDACIDHVLVLNRKTIEIQSGNFSSWWENKLRKDKFAEMENEKHIKEISQLRQAADRSNRWAIKNENTKIGFDPIKEPDRMKNTRGYIGAKTKKAQKRVKQYERRIEREIEEKEGLLQDIENPVELKLNPLSYHKEVLVRAREYSLSYTNTNTDNCKEILSDLSIELKRGERVFLHGENGCGKSSLMKAILMHAGQLADEKNGRQFQVNEKGNLSVGSGIIISYINQDTSYLKGTIRDFCKERQLDESLFCAILRQLDLERVQFAKVLEDYSEGQKKKVLIAASLMTPAHLYIWDEPLNYIDVFSRMQIESLIQKFQPTMLLVDHDIRFQEKIATRVINL